MTVTALMSKNLRDVKTGSPKVLLRLKGVQSESETFDRDHTFVPLTGSLLKVYNSIQGNKSVIISFECEEAEYTNHRDIGPATKKTLTNIRAVKVIGTVKKGSLR